MQFNGLNKMVIYLPVVRVGSVGVGSLSKSSTSLLATNDSISLDELLLPDVFSIVSKSREKYCWTAGAADAGADLKKQ